MEIVEIVLQLKKACSNKIDLIWIKFSTICFCFSTKEHRKFAKSWSKLSDLICFLGMKKRRNLAGKETWTAKKTYCKKNIFFSKMSYDNFRNGFWNLWQWQSFKLLILFEKTYLFLNISLLWLLCKKEANYFTSKFSAYSLMREIFLTKLKTGSFVLLY